jgi:ABC-type multidrug transport system ATPase subunit
MSEEILKSLTQLLAIVSKQDNVVTDSERNYVINLLGQELDPESLSRYLEYFDKLTGLSGAKQESVIEDINRSLTVKETVQILAVCNKINKTLEQKQKIFLLIKILQLIAVDSRFTSQKKQIIETISAVFNIPDTELDIIRSFVFHRPGALIDFEEVLLVNQEQVINESLKTKHLSADLDGEIILLKLTSADMYFVKYYGSEEINLNGHVVIPGQVYIFSNGSTIKTPRGSAIYFSDLIRFYHSEITSQRISFNVHNVSYSFSQNDKALQCINISEGPGKLVGIMGVSGAGKTTLLNVLSGITKPASGKILINGIELFSAEGKKNLKGVIGYISQDDLLIEELSVYDNLYYNARLCFSSLPVTVLHNKVAQILKSLGLWERRNLRVGSILDKKLSGGQRKRLNIALELIREPSILFVDEPTSGLSSRDSENVMDLLKELSYRGKLIFVVIHQPSSDIYKLFDKIYLIDIGGYTIYYGNPLDAVIYFKKATRQIHSDRAICGVCGNVNPEQIFNIVEERAVDELGNLVEKRKVTPKHWEDLFLKSIHPVRLKDETEKPKQSLDIPSGIKQSMIFMQRDFFKKIADRQYLLINLLEAPVLAFILALIVRYNNFNDNAEYRFRFNDNFPVFIMMSIIVALFFGLMVSAEEIIGDRKILKRESFLNLSWDSYLISKMGLLSMISAIQTITYVIIANSILEIKGMIFPFWIILFSVSCFGNLLGLNISSAFTNSVTVYILIPLLIIPQMILSGLLVSFDKINTIIGNKSKVPVVADFITTRWAYEAMAVYQFKNNEYEKSLYQVEQEESQAAFKSTFYIEKLRELMQESIQLTKEIKSKDSVNSDNVVYRKLKNNLNTILNEIRREPVSPFISKNLEEKITIENIRNDNTGDFYKYTDDLKSIYRKTSNNAGIKKERLQEKFRLYYLSKNMDLEDIKNRNYNDKLADLVRNTGNLEKAVIYQDHIVQLTDPIYNKELHPENIFDYRAHFFAPIKPFVNVFFSTFHFNIAAIWLQSLFLYFLLHFDILRKAINLILRKKTFAV